jgi:hypothetical protein
MTPGIGALSTPAPPPFAGPDAADAGLRLAGGAAGPGDELAGEAPRVGAKPGVIVASGRSSSPASATS